jgi:UDP-glucuronate decarboxylase
VVIDLTGSASTIVHLALPLDDPTRRRPDISVARRELGWEPTTGLKDGLAQTAADFDPGWRGLSRQPETQA